MQPSLILTIAVICKNEEKNIAKCLDSIFAGSGGMAGVEVLLADSFSTDRTIEIASRYPVKIIRLKENWRHSPAAGRYTAFRHARGRYTMSIDADMELAAGFPEKAMAFLDERPQAAGVTGMIRHTVLDCMNCERGELTALDRRPFDPQKPALLKSLPGAAVFRTAAVLRAGNFHPFLRAEEEYELCQRLRRDGGELWYLPYRIADHHGYSGDGWEEIKRRWRRGFMKGIGEMFRVSATSGFLVENALRFRLFLVLGAYALVAPSWLILGFFTPYAVWMWPAGCVLIILGLSAKKKSIRLGMLATVNNTLIGIQIVGMLFRRIPSANKYPDDPVIIDLSTNQSYLINLPP